MITLKRMFVLSLLFYSKSINARVSIKGAGEDKNQVNQSKKGLGMARRVSINLIKN
jgi:hypothetical protein